jgi:hypothetical protein
MAVQNRKKGQITQSFHGKVTPKGKGTMWGLLLFLGSLFMFPFFWFFYLRNDKANAA